MRVCGVALVSCVAIGILKIYKSEFVLPVGALAGIVLLCAGISLALPSLSYVSELAEASAFSTYFSAIFKALGIGIIAESAASVCRDSGQGSIASKVEFCAKMLILSLSLPIIRDVCDMALGVLE